MFEGPLSGKTQYDKGLPLQAVTIAEVLRESGYSTGMFGKWHLGYHDPFLPTSQGFDTFVGLAAGDGDHHSHIDRWGRADWWKNSEPGMEEGYSVELITRHSRDFILENKDRPFLLYIPHLAIHFPWQGPDDPPHRQQGKSYEDDKWGIIPDRNNVHPHTKAMIEAVDRSVGEIMNTLKSLDLEENTLVIFTSDNGGYIHYDHKFHHISSNGALRGQKAEVYEGGHRVPFIAFWPGKIKAGTTTDQTAMSMDLFPTFAELANVQSDPSQPADGINLNGLLLNGSKLPERTLFWKMDDEFAVRKGKWKLLQAENKEPELYNLAEDLGETQDLASTHPEIKEELLQYYRDWKTKMSESAARWDLITAK
jgi:arylsulfatase A-like enzyme